MQHPLKSTLRASGLMLCATTAAWSQADREQDHIELRALKDAIVAGITSGDIDAIVDGLHPDCVVTWQNGEVCRGREAVREFYENMAAQPKKTFQGYKVPPTSDEPTIFYSDATAGVVFGHNVGRFFLMGKEIEMPNRWTATVVKTDDRWQVASYHVSMNVLDNPMLSGVKTGGLIGAGIALLGGGGLGWFIGRRSRREGAR